ncbi:MAG: mannose/fructose/sorbose PTS transporter subunit IIA [Turicibacter sp.]|nr:mannose/fructose/sorbose PTS transporter subunit IIA [Turicibacter sp.]
MVGIILATHGKFSEGILQSGEMIFGVQENVKAVTLMPDEGPDDVKAKMEAAVASFDQQEEVLFLVDLWGGTPFNQANGLIEGKEKWAIVAGLNLPMLIEAFVGKSSMTAHDLATKIAATALEGVKVKPESLAPVSESAATQHAQPTAKTGAIPEGTVMGDGEIDYVLARIDTRLLHGQVATAWTKATNPNRIIVVSDVVATDKLRKQLISQAAPPGVKAHVVPIDKMIEVAKDVRFGDTKALLLFETPQDALRAIEGGVKIKELNVGSMAHSKGKVVASSTLAMDEGDVATFEALAKTGVKFDVRKVPADSKANFDNILKKAKDELAKR